ncbi:tRNA nucleotidyltransferase [filamentous cyanobacterium CCP5]|nr:tRNA nucleotidyltransferase [filamentous cyanobacterium CCP5]
MPTQQSALSPDTWPFDLSLLPETTYLVGGSVRDALLGRRADYLDLDFVLPQDASLAGSGPGAIAVAQFIAKHCGAGFVVLDATHQIARVVFERATVDFAQQVGPNLEADLHRRDFTINAIAYHPHSQTLFDPIGGHQDLQRRLLRMIAPDNLAEDPLRLLRAYRQAAQLGFAIDPDTQAAIRHLVPLARRVAAERIRGELDCLLSLVKGTTLLEQAWRDGVVTPWLPDVTASDWVAVRAIDQTYGDLRETWPDFACLLMGWLRESPVPGLHRSWLKATKLSQLVGSDPDQAEQTLLRLKYSRAEQQVVMAILRGWEMLQQAMVEDRPSGAIASGLPRRLQYGLFKQVGPSFPGIALLALAQGTDPVLVRRLLHRFQDPEDIIAHPQPLVTGRDLIQALNLKPGRRIGELLEAIQIAQAEGLISTPAEALTWAAQQQP